MTRVLKSGIESRIHDAALRIAQLAVDDDTAVSGEGGSQDPCLFSEDLFVPVAAKPLED